MAALGSLGAPVARPGDNLDVPVERGEKGHQAVHRVFAEVALEQPRDFGLGNAHQRSGLLLRELALGGEAKQLGDDLGLEEMIVGVGQPKVGKDVGAAFVNSGVLRGHLFGSRLVREAWSASQKARDN